MRTASGARLVRDEITLGDGGVDSDPADDEATDEYRVYVDTDSGDCYFSVTTVKEFRDDPEKDDAIAGWKQKYDGTDGREYWQDILDYKSWRGTLAHYAVLNNLADRELRGDEENDALDAIDEAGEFRGEDTHDRIFKQVNTVVNEFERIADRRGITPASTIDVERYVVDDEHNYAGQYDLLYRAPDGQTVLADLKTSTLKPHPSPSEYAYRTRFPEFGLQLSAYANAVPRSVDRCEVIWIDPRRDTTAVLAEPDWPQPRSAYFREFADLAERAQATLDQFDSGAVATEVTDADGRS